MAHRSVAQIRWIFSILTASVLLAQMGAANAVGSDPKAPPPADKFAKLQADPKSIFQNLQGNPASNPELISSVRDIVMADKSALKPVIEALKLASGEEKSAIGTGLGQAATAVLQTDPAYAAEIQDALAASSDQAAILAYAAVTGNVPIGAAGGGAGGAGGGAGGSSAGGGAASGGAGAAGGGGGGGGGGPITGNLSAGTATAATATFNAPAVTFNTPAATVVQSTSTLTLTTNTAVSNAQTSVSP
jgi:hypothetical protein